jgi:hypothetical protein
VLDRLLSSGAEPVAIAEEGRLLANTPIKPTNAGSPTWITIARLGVTVFHAKFVVALDQCTGESELAAGRQPHQGECQHRFTNWPRCGRPASNGLPQAPRTRTSRPGASLARR